MFVGVLVTFGAVAVVADALLDVLAADLFLRVLVTAIAGIAAVVVADMAGCAFHIVVAIQLEILRVIEGGRRPFVLAVALTAIACDLLVETVLGGLMATLAFFAGRLLQQPMIELPGRPETFHPGMIAMAGDTVRADEFLVERCRRQRLLDWQACSGKLSYLLRLVTTDTAL